MFPRMIFAHTIADLLSLATRHLDVKGPQYRVRNLLRAITDSIYDEHAEDLEAMKKNPRFLMMMDNEDVESWFELLKASPLRLLAILESKVPEGSLDLPGIPALKGWSHIDHEQYKTTVQPVDTSSDEDDIPVAKKR